MTRFVSIRIRQYLIRALIGNAVQCTVGARDNRYGNTRRPSVNSGKPPAGNDCADLRAAEARSFGNGRNVEQVARSELQFPRSAFRLFGLVYVSFASGPCDVRSA